jgi:hypothetical protein
LKFDTRKKRFIHGAWTISFVKILERREEISRSSCKFTQDPKQSIMKLITSLVLILLSINCFSQESPSSEEASVISVVNQFFEALEKQDTVLYKRILYPQGQIWRIDNTVSPPDLDMRFFSDDIDTFEPDVILKERGLSFDIKIHNGMAFAWVPYDFKINGAFSHCGVDIFTLMMIDGEWKIVSASYTKDQVGCEKLKK